MNLGKTETNYYSFTFNTLLMTVTNKLNKKFHNGIVIKLVKSLGKYKM